MITASTMSNIVKDPEWQKVRESLRGKWMANPQGCCNVLRKYLGSIKSTQNHKIIIVMNYLVGSGFRTGRIKHSCITQLRALLQMERKLRKAKGTWNMKMIPKNR